MRGARQLLTLRGSTGIRRGAALNDLGVIEDGSVLIRDGVISAIGPTRRIENLSEARGALEIRAHGRVVMPGLIDSGMRLLVAEPDAKPKSISVAKTLQEAATVLRQSLYYGTTRAEIQAGAMPENEIRTLRHASKIRRLREEIVCTWLMRPLEGTDSGERAALREQNFQQAMKKKYARFVDLDIVPSQWPQASLLLKMIAQYGFRRKLTWRGAADGNLAVMIQRFGIRTVSQIQSLSEQWAIELARLPFLLFLSPGTECLEGDSSLLKVRAFISSGGGIVLGSGYDPVKSPVINVQSAIALAVFRMGLTPEEAISAATINAAYSAGCGSSAGSLEIGKAADLLMLNLSDYRDLPRHFGMNHTGMIIRGGNVVFNRTGMKVATA